MPAWVLLLGCGGVSTVQLWDGYAALPNNNNTQSNPSFLALTRNLPSRSGVAASERPSPYNTYLLLIAATRDAASGRWHDRNDRKRKEKYTIRKKKRKPPFACGAIAKSCLLLAGMFVISKALMSRCRLFFCLLFFWGSRRK